MHLQPVLDLASGTVGKYEVLLRMVADDGTPDDGTLIPPATFLYVAETAAIENIHRAREFAEELTALGCRFALDDFGAGFGSFYYLKYLPFDYLKIDGEFVRSCTESRTDQLVIQACVQLAHGLGKQTIAECVENAEVLRALGVDHAQGYEIDRPLAIADVLARSVDGR